MFIIVNEYSEKNAADGRVNVENLELPLHIFWFLIQPCVCYGIDRTLKTSNQERSGNFCLTCDIKEVSAMGKGPVERLRH